MGLLPQDDKPEMGQGVARVGRAGERVRLSTGQGSGLSTDPADSYPQGRVGGYPQPVENLWTAGRAFERFIHRPNRCSLAERDCWW